MSSLASLMEFERRKFTNLRAYDFQRTVAKREVHKEHDECGETALYPLSPLSLSLYYAFDNEVEIG
ncbi:hypothetical protein [Paenibacillus alginolyticus]|uniref:Uncharacterized protein n=1 Tax=Paenibacillus alginolyticus TaxID=59839 RepID=A0ABT4GL76_9BACL|nr:hypothetical protein [Paenibacillus alginolyticus]MCY9696783.1 hypothetical protein [Paenibacillus alginolyticus]MEC0148528.1 hypothetical protein [Paenibacillus alginolyticus]